jgi:hypothetical protein
MDTNACTRAHVGRRLFMMRGVMQGGESTFLFLTLAPAVRHRAQGPEVGIRSQSETRTHSQNKQVIVVVG